MESVWQFWKKGFESWEQATATLLETWLKSPAMLEPTAAMLTQALKWKKHLDETVNGAWARMGLPTRREQERMLHLLNQIQGRLIDLEEKLEDALEQRPKPGGGVDEVDRVHEADGENGGAR
jgi:hypothetical protein